MNQVTQFCPRCQAQRPFTAVKNRPFHIFHMSMSVALCGLWLPVWFYLTLAHAASATTCDACRWRRE